MLKRWQSLATFQTTNRDNSLYMLSSDYEYFRFIPVTAHFQKPARDQIERWTLAFNPCIPAGLHPHRTKVSGSLLKTCVPVINSCSRRAKFRSLFVYSVSSKIPVVTKRDSVIAFRYQLPDLRETTIIFNPRYCSGGFEHAVILQVRALNE